MDIDPPSGPQFRKDVLSPGQIVQAAKSPGVHTLRLIGPRDKQSGNIAAEVVFDISMVQGSGGAPTIHVLHVLSADYEWTELFTVIGKLPDIKDITVNLAPPTEAVCPLGKTENLPFWYSQGIPEAIYSITGDHSRLTNLTLLGFHAFGEQVDHDLLASLTRHSRVPHLSRLVLSGFAIHVTSSLWLNRIQANRPLTEVSLLVKPCRPDLEIAWLDFDELYGSSLQCGIQAARGLGRVMQKIRIDVVYDISAYKLKQRTDGNYGYTCLVNPEGLPQTIEESSTVVYNHTASPDVGKDNLPLIPPVVHYGWMDIEDFSV